MLCQNIRSIDKVFATTLSKQLPKYPYVLESSSNVNDIFYIFEKIELFHLRNIQNFCFNVHYNDTKILGETSA